MKTSGNVPPNSAVLNKDIILTPSIFYYRSILLFYALAGVAVYLLHFSWPFFWLIKMLMWGLLTWSALRFVKEQRRYPSIAIRHRKEEWQIMDRNSNCFVGVISQCDYWTRHLVVVKCRIINEGNRNRTIYWPFFWDSGTIEHLRRLRVVTRYYL